MKLKGAMTVEAAPNVRIIPASKQTIGSTNIAKKLNVAAYCRVSTDQEEQQNSYQVQIEYYTSYINANPEWNFAGIFADEGISGTQTKNRNEFNRMIRLCKKKKIDLVLCKSTSRFARNTVDCLDHIRMLKSLGIGVIFEKENINTLTAQSEFILALYSSFAQAESESMKIVFELRHIASTALQDAFPILYVFPLLSAYAFLKKHNRIRH